MSEAPKEGPPGRGAEEIDRDSWFLPEEKERTDKYLRGAVEEENLDEVRNFTLNRELTHHQQDVTQAARGAARSEMLNTVDKGYIESDQRLTQRDIAKEVPIAVASRKFDFKLPSGPYCVDVTDNGRIILTGGLGGHIALFDVYNGQKFFELHPEDEVRDVCILHNETMSAVATSKSVYTYDKQGILIHDLRDNHSHPKFIDFLPNHWLLVSVNDHGRLAYTDITDGRHVTTIPTKRGEPRALTHSRQNGVVAVGHSNGVVSFWTPNSQEPSASVFCHQSPVNSVAFDVGGTKFVTSGCDGTIRVWDVRNFDRIHSRFSNFGAASFVKFSAAGVLGVARGNRVEFYEKYDDKRAFLVHRFETHVSSFEFAMFDDFALCGLEGGIASVIVPGSGEPNIDSNVANPYETVEWRQNQEVKRLLDKIPADMITMEAGGALKVGIPVNKQKQRAEELKKHRMVREAPKVVEDKKKKGASQFEKNLERMKEVAKQLENEKEKRKTEEPEPTGPLARFEKAKSK